MSKIGVAAAQLRPSPGELKPLALKAGKLACLSVLPGARWEASKAALATEIADGTIDLGTPIAKAKIEQALNTFLDRGGLSFEGAIGAKLVEWFGDDNIEDLVRETLALFLMSEHQVPDAKGEMCVKTGSELLHDRAHAALNKKGWAVRQAGKFVVKRSAPAIENKIRESYTPGQLGMLSDSRREILIEVGRVALIRGHTVAQGKAAIQAIVVDKMKQASAAAVQKVADTVQGGLRAVAQTGTSMLRSTYKSLPSRSDAWAVGLGTGLSLYNAISKVAGAGLERAQNLVYGEPDDEQTQFETDFGQTEASGPTDDRIWG